MRIDPDDDAWTSDDHRFWIPREPRPDEQIIIDDLRTPTAGPAGYDPFDTTIFLRGVRTPSAGRSYPNISIGTAGGTASRPIRSSAGASRRPHRRLPGVVLGVALVIGLASFGGGLALDLTSPATTVSVTRTLIGAEDADDSGEALVSVDEAGDDVVAGLLAIMPDAEPFGGALQERAAATLTVDGGTSAVRTLAAGYAKAVLSSTLSGDRALEVYVNRVPFGHGLRGACDASYYFYGKAPKQLTELQAVGLAVVASSPADFERTGRSGIRRLRGKVLTLEQRKDLLARGRKILASRPGAEARQGVKTGSNCSRTERQVAALRAAS